jgi:acetyl-CoA carboxylase biotin carboxylase subunit
MKVLVANRGEIAIRILRTCREMNFPSVAVYSDADQVALHTRFADEAIPIGPSHSYLDIQSILSAARRSGADAIHPGYGFLAENAAFAHAVEEAGLIFIGPRPETIEKMGDKLTARRIAREAGLPVLPGSDSPLSRELPAGFAAQVQYPVMVKATAGGGGRGIRLVSAPEDLEHMIAAARQEGLSAFADDNVYLEPVVQHARHIEIQILGDGKGSVLCLGERECSIQRRRQKLIEESPAPGLTAEQRSGLYAAALRLGCALNYRSLGTVEFLLDAAGNYHFIEVNPRIQVEHPVTEWVTGLDLVHEQLDLAESGLMRLQQDQITLHGAAIETRVLAEESDQDFMPATGEITYVKEPGGPFVRVDSALYIGMSVTTDYDSLLAKVIVWSENRADAVRRMRRALQEFQIGGVPTDLPFLLKVMDSQGFRDGQFDTTYLETFQPQTQSGPNLDLEAALATALFAHRQHEQSLPGVKQQQNLWRAAAWQEQMNGNKNG